MMMKGTEVPTLKGKVVKLEPAVRPKTILLAMEDKTNNTTTADATLKFEMPLPGKVDEGTELTFEGVAESYTASPFMVVFNVDKDKLHGWTGKNEPAPCIIRPKPPVTSSHPLHCSRLCGKPSLSREGPAAYAGSTESTADPQSAFVRDGSAVMAQTEGVAYYRLADARSSARRHLPDPSERPDLLHLLGRAGCSKPLPRKTPDRHAR